MKLFTCLSVLFFLVPLYSSAQSTKKTYVCPPCGVHDTLTFKHDGVCPVCGMNLIIKTDSSKINEINIKTGSGNFLIEGGSGHKQKTIKLFYHKPKNFNRKSRVLMVIPGSGRNAWDYRDDWVRTSEKYGVLILSLGYPEKFYPDAWSYNLAGMTRKVTFDLSFTINTKAEEWTLNKVRKKLKSKIGIHELVGSSPGHQLVYKLVLLSKAGMLTGTHVRGSSSVANKNPKDWIFSDFDRIFELVKNKLGLKTITYDMFGHSAGGQILHRFVLFHPKNKANHILAANSGWYTLATLEQKFPYGLKDSGVAQGQLKTAFSNHLIVFLGKKDNEHETRGSLRRTPEADRQGNGRLERGKYFFRRAQKVADSLGDDFKWKIKMVPGVGHNHKRMSKAAAKYLYGINQ